MRLLLIAAFLAVGCGDGGGGGGAGGAGGGAGSGGSGGTGGSGGGSQTCDASNCLGCCYNNVCQPGNTPNGCGKNGDTCVACETWQACAQQECHVDPASTWDVIAVSANLATTRPSDGTSWDPLGGAPDPYVVCVSNGGTTSLGATPFVQDMFQATWPQTLVCTTTAAVLMSNGFYVRVLDDDSPASPDDAGYWPVNFTDADFSTGASGNILYSALSYNGSPTANTLTLELQPH